jgi:hypothetical protein
MKKNFKMMSLLLGLLICSLGFMACGDDDDEDNVTGPYSGNRLVGTWVWGQPDMPENEESHHSAFYVFKANGEVYYESHDNHGEDDKSETVKTGVFKLDDIKLTITWTSQKEVINGTKTENKETEVDECEIMYPEQGNNGMFLKRYYTTYDQKQGWTEEGPFWKK